MMTALLGSCGRSQAEQLSFLMITEVMPGNHTAVSGASGQYDDWLEITNTGAETVSLRNCYLSDDADHLMSYPLPDRELAPGEALVVYAAGAAKAADSREDRNAGAGSEEAESMLFAPFKLSRTGEEIFLTYGGEEILSRFTYENAAADTSLLPDGAETRYATPGYENTDEGYLSYLNSLKAPSGLIISEVTNNNDSFITHDGSIASDWVELYNASDKSVLLSDYYISDEYGNPEKCRLPDLTLEAGQYVLIACDDPLETYTDFVTGFTLGSDDAVYLARDGAVVDALGFHFIPKGGSCGRGASGKPGYFTEATPGQPNGEPYLMVTEEACPSEKEGVYDDISSLTVTLEGEGTIYYTLDGSRPTRNAAVYSGPITLDHTSVIRTLSVMDGKLDSPVCSYTYIINEHHTLPVLSLSVNREDLFDDDRGIYVEGNNNNYYQDWEREANLTLFEDGETVFNANCGLKMYGGESRMICPKKSFRVGFKTEYGPSSVDADLFGNGVTKFKSLVLRGGEASETTYFRTEAFARLSENMDILTQSDKYCVLYVNGEYWGIFALLERFSDRYLAEHWNVPAYTARVEKGQIEDDAAISSYVLPIIEWAAEHDLTVPENYAYIGERVDLLSLIDWTIMEAYSRNGDISYNVRYCYTTDGSYKITWALFDLDWAFYTSGDNFYGVAIERQFSVFVRKLLKNEDFRKMFVDRMAELFAEDLKDENILSIIDSYHDLLQPEVERDRHRWDYEGDVTYDDWENAVAAMKQFVTGGNIRADMIDSFKEIAPLSAEEEQMLREAIR